MTDLTTMSRRCGIRVPTRPASPGWGASSAQTRLPGVVGNSPLGRELLNDRQSTSAALVGLAPAGDGGRGVDGRHDDTVPDLEV